MRIRDIITSFRPGENVLVRYTPDSSPELLFYLIVTAGREVIVSDIMDTLSEYCKRLSLLQLNVCDNLKVIKIGGFRSVGEILEKMEADKYALDMGSYSKLVGENVFSVVLGLHKLASMLTREELFNLVGNLSSLIGEKGRVTFYFVNKEFIDKTGLGAMELWNEIATSIIDWRRIGKRLLLHVVKSANPEIEDLTLGTTAPEILRGDRV
ncbi:hypothetical protein A3L04_01115 [Thermococcus chitonophagus]|uniref:MEDS domain-containing protein n=1 Tax=Thermococcus chitonophagus TaxID=54262 RepID=A0A170SB19_9EURY|nr:DUF257 family protein [Thermococcus chitonophagus]ASJ15769.1 hypothetical protein A3L04_01115 [Thermococcus chitonophagus]CUX76994.1 hypothetical protein CHITON_0215 [Thermococcus chitonophagus]